MKCELKRRLAADETVLGTWVTVGHTDVADILARLGFDWIVFDMEHGPLGPESVNRLIQAVGSSPVCPLVRVGAIDQFMTKSVLDMGAHGVVFPLVNSGDDARKAVSFVKYPPVGIRGVGPRRAADYGKDAPQYLRTANATTVVIGQIETREALGKLDEILGEDGLDVGFVGPSDLTMALGLVDDRGNPKVISAMRQVVKACEKNDRVPGILAASPEEAVRARELGFRFIALGSDVRFLTAGADAYLGPFRR